MTSSATGPLLAHADPLAGIPLSTADGLLAGSPPGILSVGVAPTILNDYGGATYSSDNFAWSSNIGNVEGPTPSNKILIGQFTTDGTFTFCLNLWVRIPDSLVCQDPNCHEILEFYSEIIPADTLGGGFQVQNKFSHPTLCFDSSSQQVDCEGVPGGPAVPGSTCDDGNADTQNDVYNAGCQCVGEDCEGVLGGNALPGQPCDDGDPNSVNDTWQTGCICSGVVGLNEQLGALAEVVVLPNPVHDRMIVRIVEVTEGTPATAPTVYSHANQLNYISTQSPSTIILHGGVDIVVSYTQSILLRNKLQTFGVVNQYVFYPTENHGWTGPNLVDSFDKITAFLNANVN